MRAKRRLWINAIADYVRNALGLREDQFPVDVEACILNMGGNIVRSAKPREAMIQKCGESFRITINRDLHPNRERFSLAHEIGHLFLHMGFCINEEKWNSIDEYRDDPLYRFGYSEEEYEAHEFAGAFLMPRDVFRDEVATHTTDRVVDIKEIAKRFGVSVDAALRRGQWLGLISWDC